MLVQQCHITHKCGHEAWLRLEGETPTELENRHQWETEHICRACFAADRAKADAAAVTVFEKLNTDLPKLTGTPRQIAFARALRAKGVPLLEAIIDAGIQTIETSEDADPSLETVIRSRIRAGLDIIERTDSTFWIDHRRYFTSPEAAATLIEDVEATERARAEVAAAISTFKSRRSLART